MWQNPDFWCPVCLRAPGIEPGTFSFPVRRLTHSGLLPTENCSFKDFLCIKNRGGRANHVGSLRMENCIFCRKTVVILMFLRVTAPRRVPRSLLRLTLEVLRHHLEPLGGSLDTLWERSDTRKDSGRVQEAHPPIGVVRKEGGGGQV